MSWVAGLLVLLILIKISNFQDRRRRRQRYEDNLWSGKK